MSSALRMELHAALNEIDRYRRTKYGDPGYAERIKPAFADVGHEMRLAQRREGLILVEFCASWPGNWAQP